MKKVAYLFFSLILFFKACSSEKEIILLNQAELHTRAIQETRIPIKPGIPGKSPFWNINSTRFMYAPAFDFREIEGANNYCFNAVSESDEEIFSFSANEPWSPLTDIWDLLPVGYTNLTVTAIGGGGDTLGIAGQRRFYRAAIFNGPYHKPEMDYRESAKWGLEYLFHSPMLQYWRTDSLPDPEYSLYCYPSKMVASIVHGMLFYAELEPDNAKEAMVIAKNATDYLIGISEPEGSPLEYFPPTYDTYHIDTLKEYKNDVDAKWAIIHYEGLENQIMLIYPTSAAGAYLDLYNACGDEKYYDAALKIAETYYKIRDENGQWPLLADTRTGAATSENFANPGGILSLMRRFKNEYKNDSFDLNEDQIESSMMDKLNEFDFEGQFEDQKPSKRYMNLSNGPAVGAAGHYFDLVEEDSSNLAIAEEFLRFAEDQFVVWSDPIPEPRPGEFSKYWSVFPCALEQYQCYTPIDAHAVSFASIFMKAWRVTGKEIYLAKAISLANAIIVSQDSATGRYPTWWNEEEIHSYGWINCGFHDAAAMYELGEELSKLDIQYMAQSSLVTESFPGGVELKFAKIPAGEFMMGSPEDETGRFEMDRGEEENRVRNETLHRVCITKSFYIGITQVTQLQWKKIMSTIPPVTDPDEGTAGIGDNNPVYYVSWYDCARFCNKLSELQGLTTAYDSETYERDLEANGYRLATEAEWEYAYRAGTQTRFYWGDDPDETEIDDYAWYGGNSGGMTHPVGLKKPNPWGLYDMSGNVWEWHTDLWGKPYTAEAQTDPLGSETDEGYRSKHGGAWDNYPEHQRAAFRAAHEAAEGNRYMGFRVVKPE